MKDIIAMEEMDLTRDGDGYEELLASIRREFQKCVKDGTEPALYHERRRPVRPSVAEAAGGGPSALQLLRLPAFCKPIRRSCQD